jgi:hypothetical protein
LGADGKWYGFRDRYLIRGGKRTLLVAYGTFCGPTEPAVTG